MDFASVPGLVVVCGNKNTMGGFSGDDAPRVVIPSLVGNPRGGSSDYLFIGDEAVAKQPILKLFDVFPASDRPLRWNHVEDLLYYTFTNELSATPSEHKVLLSSFHDMDDEKLEKICSLMFETFRCKGLNIADNALLSLLFSGRTTGCVLQSGHGVTRAACFYETLPIRYSSIRAEKPERPYGRKKKFPWIFFGSECSTLGGSSITRYLMKLLNERRGYNFNNFGDRRNIRYFKERFCYVSLNPEEELRKMGERENRFHEFVDGTGITFGSECFECTEALFNPELLGFANRFSMPELIFKSINKCNSELHKELFQNIVLSGGNTMFEGLKERLEVEIRKLEKIEKPIRVKVNAPMDREFGAWIGGSILSSLSDFQKEWVSLDDYEEKGFRHVREKCQFSISGIDVEGHLSYLRDSVDVDIQERLQFVVEGKGGGTTLIYLDNLKLKITSTLFLLNTL